jgi:Protein of unknown function (DUF4065)
MPIQFRFHPEKAVEAAAVLLKLHGKPMKYLGLLKMLYIADRVALKRMEQPITGDHYVSMDYGPVLSGVYDMIKGKPVDDALPLWSKFISPGNANYDVSLLGDPGDEDLCESFSRFIKLLGILTQLKLLSGLMIFQSGKTLMAEPFQLWWRIFSKMWARVTRKLAKFSKKPFGKHI